MLLLLGSACVEQRATVRAAAAEGLLQDRLVKPAGAARAEMAGFRSRVCAKRCSGRAVCLGAGTGVYLCANISVEIKRCSWVSEVLCVHEVKLFKEGCRGGLDAVPPCVALELDRCEVGCRKGEPEVCVVASEMC